MSTRQPSGAPELAARKRLLMVSLFVFFLFSLLIVQFFKIQIIEGEKWAKAARAQHQLVVIEPFKRGLFYSNTSIKQGHPEMPQPFVVDIPKFHLYADPNQIPVTCRDEVVNKLISFLPAEDIKNLKLRDQLEKKRDRANWSSGSIVKRLMRSKSGGFILLDQRKFRAMLFSLSKITNVRILLESY